MADDTAPACDTISHHVIPTERAGALNVWVQGDLSLAQSKESRDSYCTFLTVHDVGVNHNSWLRFMNSPSMAQIREKAVFLHVDLLGQEDQAEDLEKDYPSMQVRIFENFDHHSDLPKGLRILFNLFKLFKTDNKRLKRVECQN